MKSNVIAINGGEKTVKKDFPWPIFDEGEVRAVEQIVRSGQWGNPDCTDWVERFESRFAEYCGSKYAVSIVNGSVALRVALIACGLKCVTEASSTSAEILLKKI